MNKKTEDDLTLITHVGLLMTDGTTHDIALFARDTKKNIRQHCSCGNHVYINLKPVGDGDSSSGNGTHGSAQ